MIDKKLLTIGVPAYNVENFLVKCLDSFLCEGKEYLDVIIVNDGSSDNTKTIAERYVENYPGIYRLINKSNGGHGSCINTALQNAKGKYFKLVDGDDWLDIGALKNVLNILKAIDADLVLTDYVEVHIDTGVDIVRGIASRYETDKPLNFENDIELKWCPMHSYIVKTDVYRDNNIKMYENCFYVDTQYTVFPIRFFNSFYAIAENLYCYRLGNSGQSVSDAGFRKHMRDHERVLESLFEYISKYPDKNSRKYLYIQRVVNDILLTHIEVNERWIEEDSAQFDIYKGYLKHISSKYGGVIKRLDMPRFYKFCKVFRFTAFEFLYRMRKRRRK